MNKITKTILSIDVDWVGDPRTFKDLLKTVSPIIQNTSFEKIVFSQYHKDFVILLIIFKTQFMLLILTTIMIFNM